MDQEQFSHAARNDEAISQDGSTIDVTVGHNHTLESSDNGTSSISLLKPALGRRPVPIHTSSPVLGRRVSRGKGAGASQWPRSHDRSQDSQSPQGFSEAEGTLCSSPVSGEFSSPSFSAAMSSPETYFRSPPPARTSGEQEQGTAEDGEDGGKWGDGLSSRSPLHSPECSGNGFRGNQRRSSTGETTMSRSSTLLNSPTPDDGQPKGLFLPHGKLGVCEETEEPSGQEDEVKEKPEGGAIVIEDDGKGISEKIWPMPPARLTKMRYGFRERHIEKKTTECMFKPRQTTFEDEGIPEGWTKIIGPEGFPYFWHAKHQIITDTWIPDPTVYELLADFFNQIQEFMARHKYERKSNYHLVLDVHEEKGTGDWWCGYYVVDHSSFSVFWYEETKPFTNEIFEIEAGKLSPGQMKVYIQWEYWKHWCLFPDLCPTPLSVWEVAENLIRVAQTDVLTSDRPATNFTYEKLHGMMSTLLEAKESYVLSFGKTGIESPLPARQCPWFIGRFMEPLARERYLNFYGEKHARIDANQSVYGEKARVGLSDTSLPFRILSPLLFCAPEILYRKMEILWVDRIVHAEPWNHFFDTLSQDWAHQLVYGSILLTSNIAFLTVPNVTSEDAVIHGTLVQIPSYVSTIATIGSIILGLAFNRQQQGRKRSNKLEHSTAPEIQEWLMKRCNRTRGLEPLAVMYSLPFALLMWGMVTFLASFALMCFNHTTIGARIFTAISAFIIVLFIGWFWWMSWDETTNRWASACGHIQSLFQEWKPFSGLLSVWGGYLKERVCPADPALPVSDGDLEKGYSAEDRSSVTSHMTTVSRSLQCLQPAHAPRQKVSSHSS
ncbi:hypothetical protein BKA70DRAFT_731966 [Coprinopsis sp. MPI-PUGE-AT-0042]|nr:hypothetical protein BKA70DRAFT_731966 [Coprinopsis sp. MPI-PUGE-AT-0042]